MFAEVVLNNPLARSFVYRIPAVLADRIQPYVRVKVEFGRNKELGIVIAVKEETAVDFTVKDILTVYDDQPLMTEREVSVARWVSSRYFSSLGEALFLFVPKGLKELKKTKPAVIPVPTVVQHELNEEQSKAFERIHEGLNANAFRAFLLYGITGSGKTEIYFRIIAEVLKKGKQVILLLPEIALTPQMIRYFTDRLGEEIAVIHSKVTREKKLTLFRRILKNELKIVIGPRSALFSPTFNLGAIIIDEEHDDSYKSGQKPRYDSRFVAMKKAREYGAVVVMGSATPSIESWHAASAGELELLRLRERYNSVPLPAVELIDLKKEKGGPDFYLSTLFIEKMRAALARGSRIIIYLNRRGFNSFLQCAKCGETIYCEKCSIPYTFHKRENLLRCHYCGTEVKTIETCPKCGSTSISFKGTGTERIEELIKTEFAEFRVGRFDADSVKTEGYDEILRQFREGELDILIGTQMITKGHHFPSVSFVGVINADILLNLPDFRANEKTFQTLVQVAGRSGRGDMQGEVVIQTLRPEHYAVALVATQDYGRFIREELELRKELEYPPFVRILRIVVRGKDLEKVGNRAKKIGAFIRQFIIGAKLASPRQGGVMVAANGASIISRGLEIIGPAPAPIEKIDENFRWHIILKSKKTGVLTTVGNLVLTEFPNSGGTYVELDIDPVTLL